MDYKIIIFGILLVCAGCALPFWWKNGNAWGLDFENWRSLPLSTRYARGQQLSLVACFAGFCVGFLSVLVSRPLENSSGLAREVLLALFVILILFIFVSFALYLMIIFFKRPRFLVPPWGRDESASKRAKR